METSDFGNHCTGDFTLPASCLLCSGSFTWFSVINYRAQQETRKHL